MLRIYCCARAFISIIIITIIITTYIYAICPAVTAIITEKV